MKSFEYSKNVPLVAEYDTAVIGSEPVISSLITKGVCPK